MSVLIATPVYNGLSLEPFNNSCYFLKKELDAAGIEHDFLRITKESLITRARNVIATDFMDGTAYRCLAFVDADIQFDPADVARLWNLCCGGADVAVGHYRHKNIDAPDSIWVDHVLQEIGNYTEPVEVTYAGTGFMMIRRETFERLKAANPKWRYQEGFPEGEQKVNAPIKECWAFFQDPIVSLPNGKFHLSEDYFFCREVQKLGMKVVCDPLIKLKHWGYYPY